MIIKHLATYLCPMFTKPHTELEIAKKTIMDEDVEIQVQRYLVSLVLVLEAEGKGHELNLTRAFSEVIATTKMLINP
jgi:hypothetical protein